MPNAGACPDPRGSAVPLHHSMQTGLKTGSPKNRFIAWSFGKKMNRYYTMEYIGMSACKRPDKIAGYNTQFVLGIVTQSPACPRHRRTLQQAGDQGESPVITSAFIAFIN